MNREKSIKNNGINIKCMIVLLSIIRRVKIINLILLNKGLEISFKLAVVWPTIKRIFLGNNSLLIILHFIIISLHLRHLKQNHPHPLLLTLWDIILPTKVEIMIFYKWWKIPLLELSLHLKHLHNLRNQLNSLNILKNLYILKHLYNKLNLNFPLRYLQKLQV